MNNNRLLTITALVAFLCSLSFVPQAVAYSSSLESAGFITVILHDQEIHISDGGDIQNYTFITPTPLIDGHQYLMKKTDTVDGHPASMILASKTTGTDIVKPDDAFDISVTIPQGVYFCFRIEANSYLAQNQLTFHCDSPVGEYQLNHNVIPILSPEKTNYIGMVKGELNRTELNSSRAAPDLDKMWIHSDTEDITFHIWGSRGEALDSNWGDLKITVIMKETVVKDR